MTYGVVYEIRCTETGFRYIGQTTMSIRTRWQGHVKASLTCDWELSKAIRQFGSTNFVIRVVCECNSKEELDRQERAYIRDLNTVWPHGYNMTNGGEGPCEVTRKLISQRTREAMADPKLREHLSKCAKTRDHTKAIAAMINAWRGRKHTDASRAKMKRTHSEEDRKKISLATKGKVKSPEHREKIRQSLKGRKKNMTQQKVDLYQPIVAARIGAPPVVLRVGVTKNADYAFGGVPSSQMVAESYVLLSALPAELQAQVKIAVQVLLAGM